MSIIVIVEFFVKPEFHEEFLARLSDALPDSRKADGSESVIVHTDLDQPGHVVLVESWRTRADQQKYVAWRQSTGSFDASAHMNAAPPTFVFLEAHPEI